jgi:uncharacterized repeat protein (TIGR03803 family)
MVTPGGGLTSLFSFNGTNGSYPEGGLTLGTNGLFYGTTFRGGTNDQGTLFLISSNGAFTNLWSFTSANTNGYNPPTGLTLSTNGNFYGVNYSGNNTGGSIFQITPAGVFSLITASVSPGPSAGRLVQGKDGNFYGATVNSSTVYKMPPAGPPATIFTFTGSAGAIPTAGLIQGADGNFYGSTFFGGNNGQGVFYKLTSSGAYSNLVFFTGSNGSGPDAEMIQNPDGSIYGTTSSGGSRGGGNVVGLVETAPVFESVHQASGQIVLTWNAVLGQTYQLQSSAVLSPAGWNNLGNSVVATNIIMTATDSSPQAAQNFYRVQLQ